MVYRYRIFLFIILLASFFSVHAQVSPVSPMDQLIQLIQQNRTSQAYQLAKQMENEYSGNSRFDFLYGVAALNSGHPNESSFIFERVLMQQPYNMRARLLYAVSFYQMGSYEPAKLNFRRVLNSGVSPDTRDKINRFFRAMEGKMPSDTKTKLGAFVRINAGYTSNANSATQDQTVNLVLSNIPISLSLSQFTRAQSSPFWEFQAGTSLYMPINDRFRVFGNIVGIGRRNTSAFNLNPVTGPGKFNTNMGLATAGFGFDVGKYRVTVPFSGGVVNLDRVRFRNNLTAAAEITRMVGKNDMLGVYTEGARLYFPTASSMNSRLVTFGPLWQHYMPAQSLRSAIKLYYGRENPNSPGVTFVRRGLYGGSLGLQWMYSKVVQPYSFLQYTRSIYDGIVPGFPTSIGNRNEKTFDFSLGCQIKMTKKWLLEPSYSYSRNISNTSLYNFSRHQFMLGLTYTIDNLL